MNTPPNNPTFPGGGPGGIPEGGVPEEWGERISAYLDGAVSDEERAQALCSRAAQRGLYLSPVHAYRKYVKSLLRGRNRTNVGYFKGFDDEIVERDGVKLIPFLINVGNKQDELDDRLFYLDANLSTPEWQVGDLLAITSQDKAVISWQRATELPTPA